jgi:hypothetical protein
VKRLWPLPVFLLLALPVRAQGGEETAADPPAAEELAPPEGGAANDAASSGDAPNGDAPDAGSPAAVGSSDVQGGATPNGGDEGGDGKDDGGKDGERGMGVKPEKEKPFISITADSENGESLEPAQPVKKAVADATLIKGPKKTRGPKAGKVAKLKNAPPPVLKAKVPVVIAPPPVPVSAVPLTPITPRNP